MSTEPAASSSKEGPSPSGLLVFGCFRSYVRHELDRSNRDHRKLILPLDRLGVGRCRQPMQGLGARAFGTAPGDCTAFSALAPSGTGSELPMARWG
jgi:hypothetical protein